MTLVTAETPGVGKSSLIRLVLGLSGDIGEEPGPEVTAGPSRGTVEIKDYTLSSVKCQ